MQTKKRVKKIKIPHSTWTSQTSLSRMKYVLSMPTLPTSPPGNFEKVGT